MRSGCRRRELPRSSGPQSELLTDIAKAIADAHSGRISAAYQNGKAVFTVVLSLDK